MLDEHEWQVILPDLTAGMQQIKDHRRRHNLPIQEAKDPVYGGGALEHYFQLTGYRETKVEALWHHRLAKHGPPCRGCGKPLRTPRAAFCAACGLAST